MRLELFFLSFELSILLCEVRHALVGGLLLLPGLFVLAGKISLGTRTSYVFSRTYLLRHLKASDMGVRRNHTKTETDSKIRTEIETGKLPEIQQIFGDYSAGVGFGRTTVKCAQEPTFQRRYAAGR